MTSEKRIHRAKHDTENPYYIASRETAQDKAISYDALGMLNYILSKPDDWIIQPTDLEREKCKRNKVYSILKELIETNYIERIYHRNEKKQVVMVEYVAHEQPLVKKPLPEKPEVEKPKVENRHSTEYRRVQSTENTQSTEGNKRTKVLPALHEYIQMWAEVRGIDSVNIGAPIHTKYDTACAKRMAKWETPPTCEEIKAAISASKSKTYAFQWLEKDIPAARLLKKPTEEKINPETGLPDIPELRGIHTIIR